MSQVVLSFLLLPLLRGCFLERIPPVPFLFCHPLLLVLMYILQLPKHTAWFWLYRHFYLLLLWSLIHVYYNIVTSSHSAAMNRICFRFMRRIIGFDNRKRLIISSVPLKEETDLIINVSTCEVVKVNLVYKKNVADEFFPEVVPQRLTLA